MLRYGNWKVRHNVSGLARSKNISSQMKSDDRWRAALERKINNFAIMSNPAGSLKGGFAPSNSVRANAPTSGHNVLRSAHATSNEGTTVDNPTPRKSNVSWSSNLENFSV